MSNQATNKLEWVQGLRGLAVLLVVLTHARYYFQGTETWGLAEKLFYPGAMGVDLFFLISGFIMVHTTMGASGGRAAALFAAKRLARIWPAYAVVTLAWVFIGLDGWAFFNNPDNLRKLYKSLTLQPVDPASAPFFDLVFPLGWTLAFEMYFYIVFGVAMLAGRLRWFALASWMLLTLILLPAMQGGPTLNVRANLPFSWSYMQLMTNPIIYEFLAGVVIGLLYQSDRFKFSSASVARQVALVAVGLAAWYAYAGIGNFHGISRWGWPLALMVGALALASKTVQLPVPSWLAWIGTISYSMYLTHFLCQTMLTGLMTRRGIDTHTWGQVFITVLLAIPLASLSHYLLEQRLGEAVRARLVQLVDWLLPAASRQSEKVVKIAEIAKLPKRPRRPG